LFGQNFEPWKLFLLESVWIRRLHQDKKEGKESKEDVGRHSTQNRSSSLKSIGGNSAYTKNTALR